jgi:2,3-diphosphopglycerate-independent phosphoglycerate mutase
MQQKCEKKPKVLFLLIDGLGDVPSPQLQNRTPLQAAKLPTFDWLAARSLTGLMSPVEPGVACGSDTAHLSILGYDPRIYYKGRGAFETIGAGLPMASSDIAFKVNPHGFNSLILCVVCVCGRPG